MKLILSYFHVHNPCKYQTAFFAFCSENLKLYTRLCRQNLNGQLDIYSVDPKSTDLFQYFDKGILSSF